jgi:hypothetical protein
VTGTAKAVHPDVAQARHQDDPAAHCSDDIAVAHLPGACLAALPDAPVPAQKVERQDASDNVARLTALQQGEALPELPLPDVLPAARFPVLQQAAKELQAVAPLV